MAPQTTKFSIKPPMTMKDPRQEYSWISQSVSGAKMNVPMPDPATAIPNNIEKTHFKRQQFLRILKKHISKDIAYLRTVITSYAKIFTDSVTHLRIYIASLKGVYSEVLSTPPWPK